MSDVKYNKVQEKEYNSIRKMLKVMQELPELKLTIRTIADNFRRSTTTVRHIRKYETWLAFQDFVKGESERKRLEKHSAKFDRETTLAGPNADLVPDVTVDESEEPVTEAELLRYEVQEINIHLKEIDNSLRALVSAWQSTPQLDEVKVSKRGIWG